MTPARRRPSFWPTATQRALLEVACGPIEHAAERWEGLRPLDLTTLPPGTFPLMPLLYERLAEVAPDEPQLPRLLGTARRAWYRNRLMLRTLAVVLEALRERDVETLLAGSAGALLRWYPSLGSRPLVALELLVRPGAAAEALAAAVSRGWAPTTAGRDVRLVDENRFQLVLHDGAPPALAGPLGRAAGYLSLRARAVEIDEAQVDGAPLALDPADELLFLCATGARTVVPSTCQWLVDIHHLLASGALPAADAVIARAYQFRVVEQLREAVACAADILGAEAVGELLPALHAQPRSRRERAAFRLATVRAPRLVPPAQLLAAHLQATAGDPLLRSAVRFPRHVQETWQAPSLAETLRIAAHKSARLARAQDEAQPPDAGRSHSASS